MENLERSTISWERLGEVYYRKYSLSKLKDFKGKISYSQCHIAVSRNGGLIAFIKKSKTFIMDITNPIKDSIRIFYQDGTPVVGPIRFEEKDKIIRLFEFTDNEDLVLILNDGRIYKFDIFTYSFSYKMASTEFNDNNILDARLFDNGIVCLTQNGDFYMINNITEPSSTLFFSTRKFIENYIPIDYLFIPSLNSKSNLIELIFPHPKHGIVHVTENGDVKYIKHSNSIPFNKQCGSDSPGSDDLGKINNIILSPNHLYIAMYNDAGNIFVFPVTLDEYERRMSMTKLSLKMPYQIMWCSEDCVILVNNGSIFMVGPENKLLKIDIIKGNQPNLHCISETDGIRIIFDDSVDFLQKVNDDLYLSIFPLSFDPSKKLLEAYKFAEDKRPNCDEEIRKIRQDLQEAVSKLLIAATTQWDISNQIYLIKAAQHGKTFLTKNEFNFNHFVSICRDLRILNNLRTNDNPRLITYEQYKKLDPKQLINLLIKTQNFFLAHEVCLFLNMKVRKVYQKWAVAKIKSLPNHLSSTEENENYLEIQKKLNEVTGISYIKLAKKAFKYRKEEIGIKFLENEKSILTKIPQYMELRKWDKALELAFDTYDSNVILTVIDKIMKSESVESFKGIVSKYKKADYIVLEYLKVNHENLVKEYLEEKKNFETLFFYYLENYFQSSMIDKRRINIKEAKNCIKFLENQKDFDYKYYKLVIEDIENSLLFKKDLLLDNTIKQTDISSFDCNTFDNYRSLMKMEKMGMVELKNKSMFQTTPRKLAILRLKTYAENGQIDAIKLLSSNMRNSNLNYINLADICVENKLYDLAVEYIKKITEEDYFDYKIAMLKFIEKYSDALEVILTNKKFERKKEYMEDILLKAPDLRYKADELIIKFKVQI